MENKIFYFFICILGMLSLMACNETTINSEVKETNETIIVESDLSNIEIAEKTDILTDSVEELIEDKIEQPVVETPQKDVFEIYKNGVRQNLVIAWNTDPENATEDWVWFNYDLDVYFNKTKPIENLMYFPSPPDGIEFHHMAELVTELGIQGDHAGYYMIDSNGKKLYMDHDLVDNVINEVYTFFEIEKPID